jgi:hypothetical protein
LANSQIQIPKKTSPETLYEGQPNGIVHTSWKDFSNHPKGVECKLSQIIYRKSLSTQFCIVKRLWYMKFCLVWTAAMSNIAAWILCAQLVHRCHPVPTPWLQVGTRGMHQTVSSLVYFCHYKVSFLHSRILVKGQQHFPLVWISSLHCESMACSMTFKTGGSPKREGMQWCKTR